MKEYYESIIEKPLKSAEGCTRWWWYGCAVTKEEITRQLGFMKEAGIGGVEVQVLYPIAADNEKLGIKNIPYFSPEFFEIVNYACDEAERFEMTIDFTLGSSWPYGGEFIPKSLAAPHVSVDTIDVTGPCKFSYDFTTRLVGEIESCSMGKMENSKMIPETVVDITDKIVNKLLFNWPWGQQLVDLEIPEGNYKIVVLSKDTYNQRVLAPSRGGEGYVIDHCNKEAADLFFDVMGNGLVDKVGKGRFNSFFCDSLELTGHNWTQNLFDEFEKRCGYDLKPYTYALYGEIDEIGSRIRYDFKKVMSDLTLENFFETMTSWCNKVGSKSRIQAHGTWADIIEAYAAADMPEGETFSAYDKLRVNTVHRKLASSAGHLYSKAIVSNESFTWLRFPRFTETLENIKAASDSIFMDGMNKIYNHGYTYTPEVAGKEGWPFYASCHINHTNPWWDFYKNIGTYVGRVSSYLQTGTSYSEVLIYLPQADIWSENPLSDLHMSMKVEERFTDDVVDAIAKHGYWFDYVNDKAMVEKGEICQNGIVIGDNKYKTMIMMDTYTLPIETARKIRQFVLGGGKLICAKDIPQKSCGFIDNEKNSAEVKSITDELFSGKHENVIFVENKNEALIDALEKNVVPDVKIHCGSDTIGYVHRKNGSENVYFVSNISCETITTDITFNGRNGEGYYIVNPLTGSKISPIKEENTDNSAALTFEFEPFESFIIVFSPEFEKNTSFYTPKAIKETIDISENWTLDIEKLGYKKKYTTLTGWEQETELKHYSGKGIYEKEFEIRGLNSGENAVISFENIGVAARIYVNGNLAGDIIKKPNKLDVTEFLEDGKNIIKVVVANLLINERIDPNFEEVNYDGNVIDEWPYFTGKINRTRDGRIHNWRERKMIKDVLPSGIWGKVSIEIL